MAARRMFARDIVESDDFLDLTPGARALYLHLGVQADDDGFLNNVRSLLRMAGVPKSDLELLVTRGFLIAFPSGVYCLTHWKRSNYLQRDRYRPTNFTGEKAMLSLDDTGMYHLLDSQNLDVSKMDTTCIHRVGEDREGQDRVSQDREGQDRSGQISPDQSNQDQISPNQISQDQPNLKQPQAADRLDETDGMDETDVDERNPGMGYDRMEQTASPDTGAPQRETETLPAGQLVPLQKSDVQAALTALIARFEQHHGHPPDRLLQNAMCDALAAGKPLTGLCGVIDRAAARKPHNPDRYTQAAVTLEELPAAPASGAPAAEPAPTPRKAWQPSPEPQGALADWEINWMAQVCPDRLPETQRRAADRTGGQF